MSRPVRTCVGCRIRADKRDLLRLVARSEGAIVDPSQIEPGRGAYLHRGAACLELAVERKALPRALRVPGSAVVPDVLRAAVTPHLTGEAEEPNGRLRENG